MFLAGFSGKKITNRLHDCKTSFFFSWLFADLKRFQRSEFAKRRDCEAPPETLWVQVIFSTAVHSSQHSHVLAVWDCVSSVSSILSDKRRGQ